MGAFRVWVVGCLSVFLISCGEEGTPSAPTTNNAPSLVNPNPVGTWSVGSVFLYDATQAGTTFTDPDGDRLTYSVTYDPPVSWMTDVAGVISGAPTEEGTWEVVITASDGQGGSATDRFDVVITPREIDQNAILAAFGGRIDLENLASYANPDIPAYITVRNDGGNPVTDGGATLGRVLFYDTQLSIDNTVSCSSCHLQANAFGDPSVVSDGVAGGQTGRHSMRIINTQYARETRFFWDERAITHEFQESQPLQDHNEHGFSGLDGRPDLDDLIEKLEAIEYYQELFTFVFGDPEITESRLQIALAQFTKSIHSFDSKYDEGRAQVNNDGAPFPNFTLDENRGKALFLGGVGGGNAGCARCHGAPEFDIDPNSRHNGVVGVAGDPTAFDFTVTRSPSLRDLAAPDGTLNSPYMHDGSLATLRDVIDHYDQIAVPVNQTNQFLNTIDRRLLNNGTPRPLGLTDTEKDQIVQFLLTLTGQNVYTDEKWSNPFGGL